MTRFYNRTSQKGTRRRLRRESPLAERLLWSKLRRAQLDELRFRRQYSIDRYVLDFYCPVAKLAVEVDGETHFSEPAHVRDSVRQAFIESFGIQFVRFTNLQVERQLEVVIDQIWRVANERISERREVRQNPPVRQSRTVPP